MAHERLTTALLDWYRANRRTLPWREEPQPYYVLLSEFMCQQTRIDTVLPYFDRFITRWPTLADLAGASEEEVLTEWAGLGYYSRARNLLRAAQQATQAGGLTGDVAALRTLPGVGPYTAGAIASVAFGVEAALVDGNVERVLCRLDGITGDPRTASGKRAVWARAEALIAGHPAPGDHNQALMELGALICTPRAPQCDVCPVRAHCLGRAAGIAESLPNKPRKAAPTPVSGVCAVVERSGRILMGQRGPGLLGGMWEPLMATNVRDTNELVLSRAGLRATYSTSIGVITHVFTHRRLTLDVAKVVAAGEPMLGEGYADMRFIDPISPDVPLSKLARKVLDLASSEQVPLPLAAEPSLS